MLSSNARVVVPRCHYGLGWLIVALSVLMLFLLDCRASQFDTIASALGLYSAALLGVFSVLTNWRSMIIKRTDRYLGVEQRWSGVIDRSVLFALRGSAMSFLLMLFGVIAPAIKGRLAEILDYELYSFLARSVSALAISGVVLLGLMSLQIVKDITALYEWNNGVFELDMQVQVQKQEVRRRGDKSDGY